jgi:hypothetical protein
MTVMSLDIEGCDIMAARTERVALTSKFQGMRIVTVVAANAGRVHATLKE